MQVGPLFDLHSVFSYLRSSTWNAFSVSELESECSPPCQHHGVCDVYSLMCNCTSWYEGDACQTMKQTPKVCLVILLLLVLLVLLLFLYYRMNQKAQRELRVSEKDDPFVASLNQIRQAESNQQMWVGDKFQSRDSYINSSIQKTERWWKPKLRYTPVAVDTTTQ